MKRILLLSLSALALMVFAVPAAAQASEPFWYVNGEKITEEVPVTVQGEMTWVTAGSLRLGPCSMEGSGTLTNGETHGEGEITEMTVNGPCQVSRKWEPIPGCQMKTMYSNVGGGQSWPISISGGNQDFKLENLKFTGEFFGCQEIGLANGANRTWSGALTEEWGWATDSVEYESTPGLSFNLGGELLTEGKLEFASEVGSIATIVSLPQATTKPATDLSSDGATLHGVVNPDGLSTTYQFEYGPTTSYGSKSPTSAQKVGFGYADVPVQEVLSGLEAGTIYHYRVVATNAEGIAYGEDRTLRPGPIWFELPEHTPVGETPETGQSIALAGELSLTVGSSITFGPCSTELTGDVWNGEYAGTGILDEGWGGYKGEPGAECPVFAGSSELPECKVILDPEMGEGWTLTPSASGSEIAVGGVSLTYTYYHCGIIGQTEGKSRTWSGNVSGEVGGDWENGEALCLAFGEASGLKEGSTAGALSGEMCEEAKSVTLG